MVTSKEQQARNSFIYMLPLIVGSLFTFIALPIFTRILTKEDYGVVALAQIYAIFASGLVNFGMTASYDRNFFEYSDDIQKTAQLLFSTLIFVISNFLLLAGLTYIFKGALAKLVIGDVQYGNVLFWAFCAQFLNGITYYYLTYFKNSEDAKSHASYTIAASSLNFVISLFMVAFLKMGVIGLLYAQVCTGFIIFGVLSYKFVTTISFSLSKLILFESIKISYPLAPGIFFGVIRTQFDKYMIGLIGVLGGVGVYHIGQKVSGLSFTFMTLLQNVFSPQVYKKMFDLKEDGGRSVGAYLTPFAYISIFVVLLIALFSEEIIFLLTPVSYQGAIDIIIVLAMYYGFLFFGKITPMQIIYVKKPYLCTIFSLCGIIINIALNIPFIINWGALGAAWATLISSLISGTISFIVSQHYYKIKWEYRKIGLIYLIFFAALILMVILRNLDVVYTIRLLVKCVSIGSYIYLGVRINVVTIKNYLLVRNISPFNLTWLSQNQKGINS